MKKRSRLEKRIKQLNKELTAVNDDIKVLSKAADRGSRLDDLPRLKSEKIARPREETKKTAAQPAEVVEPPVPQEKKSAKHRHDSMESEKLVQEQAKRSVQQRDERLTDFLATNFQSVGPLRHERQKQRNKAIVVILAVVLIFIWMWMKFS